MTSIILPAYNAEKYLQAAIGSVLSQSDSDWELILVDDGSTDSTPQICDSASESDARIRTLHTANRGVSAARNAGLEMAKGEFIAFLDADDVLAPDFLKILKHAVETRNVSFAGAPIIRFGNDLPGFSGYGEFESIEKNLVDVESDESLETALYQKRVFGAGFVPDNSVSGKLFRREMWDKVRFREGGRYEDLEIMTKLWSKAEKICWVPLRLYGYRQHKASFIHRYSAERLDVLDVTDRMVSELAERSADRDSRPVRAARTRRFAAHCNIYLLLRRNGRPDKAAEKRCLEVIRAERGMVVRNREARMKDRFGALVSYFLLRP